MLRSSESAPRPYVVLASLESGLTFPVLVSPTIVSFRCRTASVGLCMVAEENRYCLYSGIFTLFNMTEGQMFYLILLIYVK